MTLADAIRRKGKDDAEAVWQKARADAEAYRAARTHDLEDRRSRAAQDLTAMEAESEFSANADAGREARKIVATAKVALSDRLYGIAAHALPGMRTTEVFAMLAAELPSRSWQRVTVNPADKRAAHKLFVDAEIVCDPAIAGGMDVEAEGGRVRIANTLQTRLDAAWPEILPGLMKDVLEEISHS